MAETVHISCVKKSADKTPYEQIRYVGGVNAEGNSWLMSTIEAINGIKSGKLDFCVAHDGHATRVIVARTAWGYEYLKAAADSDTPDSLLGLPEA
jgi:hypothetical protein